jgi:ApaG protein
VTRGLSISVKATYSPTHSRPENALWFFVYTITLKNEGPVPVQLLERHWEITDGRGEVQHVRGPGVVGKQPVLPPGQSFEYTSGCPLPTPNGFMQGEYLMVEVQSGESFEARIAGFPLRRDGLTLN